MNETNTKDIAFTGCFNDYNVTSCVRDSVLSGLAIITAIICGVKLYHLFHNHHSLLNQYIIFICAFCEACLCAFEWVYLWQYAAVYVITLLKLIQCVIVCRFYCTLAAHIYRKEILLRYIPVFAVVFVIVITAVCISGWATLTSNKKDCLAIQWILLASMEFIIAQFFLSSGIFVTKKLNDIRTVDDMRNAKKRELWGTIIVFEVAAVASIIHDILFKVYGDNCQGVLSTSAPGFTSIYIAFKITRWLLPIWAMAALFAIEDNTTTTESLASLVVSAPATGFISSFRDYESPNEDPRRSMLPSFLQTVDNYGTINYDQK